MWIRFPDLLVMYYDDDLLRALASVIGTPVKVDKNSSMELRGCFIRVCVELDLNKPLVAQF